VLGLVLMSTQMIYKLRGRITGNMALLTEGVALLTEGECSSLTSL